MVFTPSLTDPWIEGLRSRIQVSGRNFEAAPKTVSSWMLDAETTFLCMFVDGADRIVLAAANWGWKRFTAPFDLEVRGAGLVLWSATHYEFMGVHHTYDGAFRKGWGSEPQNRDRTPPIGWVDHDQFPLPAHGWAPEPE